MSNSVVFNYLSNTKTGFPFFYLLGDKNYINIKKELEKFGAKTLNLSEFCYKPDKFPDIDALVDYFLTADVNYNSNKWVLVGLGEYLALRGQNETIKILQKIKGISLGNARVVVLLRCIEDEVRKLLLNDIRLQSQNRIFIDKDCSFNLRVSCYDSELGLLEKKGFKFLQQYFEQGLTGNLDVETSLNFSDSILPVTYVNSIFGAIQKLTNNLRIKEENGDIDKWKRLLQDIKSNNYSLENFLRKLNLLDNFEENFYDRAVKSPSYESWLYFISAKIHIKKIKNNYLKYVLENTDNFDKFKNNILNYICDIPHDSNFDTMYECRKVLVRDFKESDIKLFVEYNSIKDSESLFNLTDNTLIEREAIISCLSKNNNYKLAYKNYPALGYYMTKYQFDCGTSSEILTDYFDMYKQLKLKNYIDKNFLLKLNENSKEYAKLDTRDNALSKIDKKEHALLLWIDAMGVEYLSYLVEIAKQKNLSMKVDIARADLPTITEINKRFYDSWMGSKEKIEALDEIKHGDNSNYNFIDCSSPIHLAKELEVLEQVMDEISNDLLLNKYDKVILISDHGSSRLAVINKVETKIPTETKGEHSGRCCKTFENYNLDNVIEENGYLILTDYSRFAGSRKSNVEVHGGASLEEIVVPVITVTTNNAYNVDVRILNKDKLYIDRKNGIQFKIFISNVSNPNNIKIVLNNKSYILSSEDNRHFDVNIKDITRSKKYDIEIYDGDDLIHNTSVNIKNKLGSTNSTFEDIF